MIKKVQAMNLQRDRLFRFKCEVHERGQRISGILLKRESLPGANEVGGHDRGKHYVLSTRYVLRQHFLVPGTIHYCCDVVSCVIRQNRSYEKCGAFRSDL